MSGSDSVGKHSWIPRSSPNLTKGSTINLVNLLLRETSHRLTYLDKCGGPDPELFVVTRVEWRDPDPELPILPQLPRVLSLLEALRGTQGVPHEVYLNSTEGIAVYLPTGMRLSEIGDGAKEAVRYLLGLIDSTVEHLYSTLREVETYFWKAAKQRGYSPRIVEKIARGDPYYDSLAHRRRFHEILRGYFSIRFRVHRSESCLHVEGQL